MNTLKLSAETISALKNFATINSNIVFEPGRKIRTIAEAKDCFASYNITDESIPLGFGIYDLNEFLSSLSMFSEPILAIADNGKQAVITEPGSRRRLKYYFSDPALLTKPPKDDLKMPSVELSFDISAAVMADIKKAAGLLKVDNFILERTDGELVVKVTDNDDPTSNEFEVGITSVESELSNFKVIFTISTMKLVPDDYQVQISSRGISFFKGMSNGINYWIAPDKKSKF